MYMYKVNIKRYGRRKFYHEICHHIYDIMVWNGNYSTDNSFTPMYHVPKYQIINLKKIQDQTRRKIKNEVNHQRSSESKREG